MPLIEFICPLCDRKHTVLIPKESEPSCDGEGEHARVKMERTLPSRFGGIVH